MNKKKIIGQLRRQTGGSPGLLIIDDCVSGDRFNFLYAMVKKEDYQMNQFEIDYWKKIHETNANQPKKTNFQRPAHISLFLSEFLKNRGNNK